MNIFKCFVLDEQVKISSIYLQVRLEILGRELYNKTAAVIWLLSIKTKQEGRVQD